jgi:hypothetical protein
LRIVASCAQIWAKVGLIFAGESAMRLAVAALVLVGSAAVSAQQGKEPHTARDYFNELKAANNFNHYKDTYVCFADDDAPSFAVIARGSDIIDEMTKAGAVPDKSVLQAKSLLFVETYYKGVSNKTQVYEPAGKEGTDWDIEFNSPIHGRMLYSINWTTGR